MAETPAETFPAEHTTTLKRRRWHQRRDIRFLAAVALCLALYEGYGLATAPGRMTEALKAALDAGPDRVDIRITSNFPPEAFHMGVYQRLGVVRGTEERTATLHRVRPADVRRLARRYWIERIDLARP